MHIVCRLPNAGDSINGHIFVPVSGDDTQVMVSEDLDDEAAARFLGITGYEPYEGDSDEIEKALESRHRRMSVEARAPDATLARTVEELQDSLDRANEALDAAKARNLELEEENAELKKQYGQPNPSWNKAQLLQFAEKQGIVAGESMTKADILVAIEDHLAKNA